MIPSGKSLLEGNMISALLAIFTASGAADMAAGLTGSEVDETGMVVKMVKWPALLKIVLETLQHQHNVY